MGKAHERWPAGKTSSAHETMTGEMSDPAKSGRAMAGSSQIVSISFFRFETFGARLWAFQQMLFARSALARMPDIGFWKLLGSGTGEGFTPVPNTGVYAILATWPSLDTARDQIEQAEVFRRYRQRASESWTVFMTTASARGLWDGKTPFQISSADSGKTPLAVLTRATIRPRILLKFWGRVPDISTAIGSNTDVLFKIGVGEVPWLHQMTFSIWPEANCMAAFAHADGPHARAVRAVREGGWFAEELYARFRVVGEAGSWDGGSPLSQFHAAETDFTATTASQPR